MTRSSVFLIVFVIPFLSAFAQDWYTGTVTLKDHKSFHGEIAIQHEYEAVLFRLGSEITVLPAHKVETFNLYDGSIECKREFVSLKVMEGVGTTYRFFEKVVAGKFGVLRRQVATWYSMHLDVLDYDYYILTDGTELVPMNKFRRKIYPQLLSATDGKLKEYIRKNNLSVTRLLDSILIIRHFNYLQGDQSLIASR